MNRVLFSHNSDEWETPETLFNELDKEFSFDIDVAASDTNYKVDYYITKEQNALTSPWVIKNGDGEITNQVPTCWCNPPYSMCRDFVKKAAEEQECGVTTVMLIPSRTDTKWFHEYIYNKPNVIIRFLKGRLKFSNSKNSAPFPSMVVIFKGNK